MTSEQMLANIRRLNHYFSTLETGKLRAEEIGVLAKEILESSVYVFNKRGVLFSLPFSQEGFACRLCTEEGAREIAESFVGAPEETAVYENTAKCPFRGEKCTTGNTMHMITPLCCASERLGYIVYARAGKPYESLDIALGELLATLAAVAFYTVLNEQNSRERQQSEAVKRAAETLSYTERQAAVALMNALSGREGVINASKIAQTAGITRSVVASAVRKLESAGIIQTRSLGMKGSYVCIMNDFLFRQMQELSASGRANTIFPF